VKALVSFPTLTHSQAAKKCPTLFTPNLPKEEESRQNSLLFPHFNRNEKKCTDLNPKMLRN